ncbi:hypothetical protein C1H46_019107 [Malus baccata]|uniref:Uncharacterized protein n=1 Tax=Malus baccata TaxID=106549 RepID=A0A540M9A9_MALBA|nr:hypothetical protein C1H46_019107 [Malus baccata]
MKEPTRRRSSRRRRGAAHRRQSISAEADDLADIMPSQLCPLFHCLYDGSKHNISFLKESYRTQHFISSTLYIFPQFLSNQTSSILHNKTDTYRALCVLRKPDGGEVAPPELALHHIVAILEGVPNRDGVVASLIVILGAFVFRCVIAELIPIILHWNWGIRVNSSLRKPTEVYWNKDQ